MSTTRRAFLRGTGLAVAAGAGAAVPVLAQSDDFEHWDAQPEHVTLDYSEDTLLEYAPRLEFEQEAREKFRGLWGWTATSSEYDHDYHVYVALYTHQEGAVGADSHLGDTEWFYVLSNPDNGDTERIVYDAYHWLAGKLDEGDFETDGTAPVATVVSPWHFYDPSSGSAEDAVEADEIGDLTEQFDAMLSNGLDEDLEPGTVTDPETMDLDGRTHWWRSTVGEWSYDAFYAETLYSVGFAGAGNVDTSGVRF